MHSNIELKTKQKSRSPSYPAIMRHRPPPFNTTHTGKSHPHLDLLLFLLFKPPRKEETNGNGSIFICTCCVCARARYHHKFPRKSARARNFDNFWWKHFSIIKTRTISTFVTHQHTWKWKHSRAREWWWWWRRIIRALRKTKENKGKKTRGRKQFNNDNRLASTI